MNLKRFLALAPAEIPSDFQPTKILPTWIRPDPPEGITAERARHLWDGHLDWAEPENDLEREYVALFTRNRQLAEQHNIREDARRRANWMIFFASIMAEEMRHAGQQPPPPFEPPGLDLGAMNRTAGEHDALKARFKNWLAEVEFHPNPDCASLHLLFQMEAMNEYASTNPPVHAEMLSVPGVISITNAANPYEVSIVRAKGFPWGSILPAVAEKISNYLGTATTAAPPAETVFTDPTPGTTAELLRRGCKAGGMREEDLDALFTKELDAGGQPAAEDAEEKEPTTFPELLNYHAVKLFNFTDAMLKHGTALETAYPAERLAELKTIVQRIRESFPF